jgi:hypothetical protein
MQQRQARGQQEPNNDEKRNITQKKYIRNQENIPYYKGDSLDRQININDSNKEQFDVAGDVVNSSDDGFMQPSDEDPQGNIRMEEEQPIIKMNDSHQTPNKEDTKPAAQPENEDSSPSPEPDRKRLNKQKHKADNMK